jgi:hypothetical protein
MVLLVPDVDGHPIFLWHALEAPRLRAEPEDSLQWFQREPSRKRPLAQRSSDTADRLVSNRLSAQPA